MNDNEYDIDVDDLRKHIEVYYIWGQMMTEMPKKLMKLVTMRRILFITLMDAGIYMAD